MDLEEAADDFLEEAVVEDFRCVSCGVEFSTDGESECPKCGSDNVESA